MRRTMLSLLPMAALCLSACATESADTDAVETAGGETAQAAEARIRELNDQWVAHVAAKDTTAIVNMYATDGRLMAPNGPAAVGHDALRSAWAGMIGLPNVSITFAPTTVRVSDDGEMAYDIGTYQMAFDGPNGRVEDDGKYVVIWEKRDGDWKVMADILNSNRPAPGS